MFRLIDKDKHIFLFRELSISITLLKIYQSKPTRSYKGRHVRYYSIYLSVELPYPYNSYRPRTKLLMSRTHNNNKQRAQSTPHHNWLIEHKENLVFIYLFNGYSKEYSIEQFHTKCIQKHMQNNCLTL